VKALVDNTLFGLIVVIPLLLVLSAVTALHAIPAHPGVGRSRRRVRLWLVRSSVVLVAVFAAVVAYRFVLR
jgi:hypothetical protein